MECKKILMVTAIIVVLVPFAFASRSVIDFETLPGIANDVSEARIGNPLSNIILKGLNDNYGATCGTCTGIGKPCSDGKCVCVFLGTLGLRCIA